MNKPDEASVAYMSVMLLSSMMLLMKARTCHESFGEVRSIWALNRSQDSILSIGLL
ncbi:hypothetical protein [Povalibacter sp.]|uniref:hypothetical protein n=1 Tax=Povalibacter sp. TaxID=1962978 RepID=UPI002F405623